MKTVRKKIKTANKKAFFYKGHRSLMPKLDDFKAFSSPPTIDSGELLFYGMKTAIKRAFKSRETKKFNDCCNSQNSKVKKLNT